MKSKLSWDKFLFYFWGAMPLWFFLILAQALRRSHGHLRLAHLVYLSLFLFLFSLSRIFPGKKGECQLSRKLLYLLVSLFGLELSQNLHLMYGHEGVLTTGLRWGFGLIPVLGVGCLFSELARRLEKPLAYYAATLGSFSLILVPIISPEPFIDVWVYQQIAADLFLSFKNPYTVAFPHLYGEKIGSTYGYPYWPVILYFGTLAKTIFSDARFAFVLMHLSVVLYWILRKKDKLLLALWLFFPVQVFVLEQAWTEGALIALIFFHLELLKKKKWLLSAVILGLICATKQTMLFYALFSCLYLFGNLSPKTFIKCLFLSIGVALLMFSPYLLWDYSAFLQETVFDVLSLKAREDALSWSSYFLKFYGITIDSLFYGILVLGALLVSALQLTKQYSIRRFLTANIVVYMVTFLFGKQAFCNYYYLIGFFLFLNIYESKLFKDSLSYGKQ